MLGRPLMLIALAVVATPGLCEDGYSRSAVLARGCSGCHSDANQAIPSLAGWRAERIADTLRAYKDDTLEGTLMNRIARGYSDTEIVAIADYLAKRHAR